MTKKHEPPMHLQLVKTPPKKGRAGRPAGAQQLLFPVPMSNTIIFVDMSRATDQRLLSMMTTWTPRHVFDCRVIPRFDFGRLNRKEIFRIFEERKIVYHDVFGAMNVKSVKNAQLSSGGVAEYVAALLKANEKQPSGPLLILLEDSDSVLVSTKTFEGVLPVAKGKSWEIETI